MSINEKDFWLNELKEAPEKCSFPGIPAAGGTERNIDTLPFQLTGEVAAKLCAVANRSDVRMHIILVAALTALLEKYTGQKDIILGAPIYKQEIEGRFINTVLALRNRVQKEMTFKELLLQVSRTIKAAAENRNFPIEKLLYGLDIPYKKGDDFPLFDASLLLDNIHDREHLRQVHTGLVFIFSHKDGKVGGVVELDTRRYDVEGIERILGHLGNVLRQVLADVNTPLSQVGILSPEEESQLLEFNDTAAEFPVGKTIHGLFREQAGRTPDSIAVSAPVLAGDVHDLLLAGLLDADGLAKLDTCCFKKAAHLFQAPWQESQGGADKEKKGAENGALQNNEILFLLKTPRHNSVIVNRNLLNLLEMFNGECGLKGMFQLLKEKNIPFIAYTMSDIDLLEVTYSFEPEARVFYSSNYTEYVSLVQLLYSNHLIKFSGYTTTGSVGEQLRIPQFDNVRGKGEHNPIKGAVQLKAFGSAEPFSRKGVCPPEASVLLLGDTPGMASIGILYLASYLKRNGIDAVCRFDDTSRDYPSMKENIRELLAGLKPSVVAVSLKWFPYINRVLDMCRIIKEYGAEIGKDITVVVGGNTASYYWREVGVFDCIDYLIRGDGEEPLLGICKGDENIPNTVYLKNGEIIEEPMAYVQDDSHSPEIHLSHLDEIILSQKTPLLGTFFIYTHKGCAMNCFYCGGCNDAQRKAFNRKNVLRRGTEEVRKDIRAGKPYASTFQFDFDTYHRDLEGYCRDIWQGIDLSAHFCIITTLTPPSEELIKLVVETFKYVYWDFDVCTLSERHRQELLSKKMVKPLPTDAEIFQFFDRCEVYRNIEVRVNSITGLPYFTYEDIVLGEQLLTDIMSRYRSFGEMHWARLHAQPGAPISLDADAYDMHSYAVTYDDFYMHSRKNFREGGPAADMESLNYPYIYSMDDQLNSDISRSYFQANKRVEQNREKEERQAVTPVTLTYRQLDRESDSLAALLAANGVAPGSIVGLMAESSVDIPVGILGIMKAGCAYMPIDTTFPAGRIDFMLQDSKAAALVLGTGVQYVPPAGLPAGQGKAPPGPPMQDRSVLQPDIKRDGGMQGDLEHGTFLTLPARGNMEALENVPQYQEDPANNLAYVIYTSGTTGNPKGVLLTHQNLVNYVSWFSRFAQLKETDKTMLTSSFAFDLGYTSIYTSLLNGGELHVLPKDIYLVADRLLNYVKAKEITYIKMTPSLFSVIVNSPLFSKSMCASLRLAVIGGEAINLKDIELARELCDFIDIINHYGPTEATIGCIAKKIDFNHFQAYEAVPVIGRPIANTGVFILDKEANLLPIGVPGELCISGTCLAKGYLNRDVLNSEKFINIRQTQATVYRTGDLARLLPDGNIQFMGRIDNQVKIRGYRVELGEIENRMLKHKDVDEAAAIFHRDKDGDNYICAYYVPANQKEQKEVSSILSEKEHTRYKRQMLLEGWGTESQEKLK
ncbi:MAG: amino acid adenylation domain-containing protein, partial [bacterium]|nr:amino acid adenylation domain-containing protein [bacterium]